MGKFIIKSSDRISKTISGKERSLIKKNVFDSFNESTLGLGNISSDSQPTNALAAIFDLANFTVFCQQMDPHLVVPDFLNSFLKWIYSNIREVSIQRAFSDGYQVWCEPPFFSKFLGDGILLIWDTTEMQQNEICNIIISLKEICDKYKTEFLYQSAEQFSSPPDKLRCGIARGIVYNVGDGNDFVGPCINMAARLQKVGPLSFCFSKKGIDYKKYMSDSYVNDYIVKKCEIRGIGENELVCILADEYNQLSSDEKKFFKTPR